MTPDIDAIDADLERIAAFLDVVDAEQQDVEAVNSYVMYDRWVINRDWWDDPVEVTITSRYGDDAMVSVSTQGPSGMNPVKAPASEWTVSQTTDDGNLLTHLQLRTTKDVSAGVSVYGPAVGRSSAGKINLLHADEDEYLL